MGEITLIFCEGDARYSNLIKDVEHGKYTHVAGIILESTLEAQGVCDEGDRYPGVWLHDIDKYVDGVKCKFVTVKVNNIEAAQKKARELLGCLYSFHGCVETGIEELFGIQLPADGEKTVMCSETWTRILEAGEPIGFSLPEFNADFVAPQRLYDAVIEGAV